MIRLLLVLAAAPFLLMGLAHGMLTLRDLGRPRAFTPPDAELRAAMQRSSIRLDPRINLWRAWLGFNLTHSLGLVLFGGAFVYVAAAEPARFASTPVQAVAVGVAATYLAISRAFFFAKPVAGAAVGLACFVAAAVLAHA